MACSIYSLLSDDQAVSQPAPQRRRSRGAMHAVEAGAIAGLIAAVLLVVTLLLLSSLPSADSPGQAIIAHLRGRSRGE